ncbi:MAG: indole-3-glycerol phosphate synthase TrpC [Phycisphaerales bacterium]
MRVARRGVVVGDFLAEMGAASRARCAAARRAVPLESVRAMCADALPVRGLRLDGFDVIAEVKRVSPAEGRLAGATDDGDVARAVGERAAVYVGAGAAGAAMVSVLTEPSRFGGELSHLSAAARAVGVPVMRKDFLVDPYQVVEARAHGASCVLLIVRMLDDLALGAMLEEALGLGMHVLVEAFDGEELDRAGRVVGGVMGRAGAGGGDGSAGVVMVGLNCRDLATLGIDVDRLESLAGAFPAGVVRVAESGVRTGADAARVARLGYGMALVGTALMRSADPGGLVREMVRCGREAR